MTIRRHLRNLAVFETAFLIAYALGMSAQESAAPFWFPDAVLLSALLVSERRTWWLYVLAPLPIRLFFFADPGVPFWFLAVTFANDSLKALLSAWLLTLFSRRPTWFDNLREFVQYFLIAVVLSPMVSAFAGAAARIYLGDAFGIAWRDWFLGDALASLILTPFIVIMITAQRKAAMDSPRRWVEGLLATAGLIITGYLIFASEASAQGSSLFRPYLLIPWLLWLAVRFGPAGAPFSLVLISFLAIFGALAGRGPFPSQSAADSLLPVQLILFFISVSFMFLSVMTTQQRRTEGALRKSEDRLRQLNIQMIRAQEAECSRIAQELHDDLSQRTAMISMGLHNVSRKYGENAGLRGEVDELQRTAADLGKDLGRIAHQLHPGMVEKLGLLASLRSLCEELSKNERAVKFVCEQDLPPLGVDLTLSLYRVAQESLRNALIHSGATLISIEVVTTGITIQLSTKDNGCGFEVGSAATSGIGLSGMADRMQNVGGTLNILSAPGKGTIITAMAPIAKATNSI